MKKKKILLIDDQKSFTESIKAALEGTDNYEVRAQNDGPSGVAAAKEFKPDLILLDVTMPNMDGTQVAAKLESDQGTRDIPIVFLTAVVSKEEVEKQKGLIGGHKFIAKPVGIEDLINVIDENIG